MRMPTGSPMRWAMKSAPDAFSAALRSIISDDAVMLPPGTSVLLASRMQLCGLPMMSTDTIGSVALLVGTGERVPVDHRHPVRPEQAGHAVGERRVWRLCSQQQLWSATVRKGRRGSGKTPGPVRDVTHGRVKRAPAQPGA